MARRAYKSNRVVREVICGVYKLTHKPSGKFYIGSSTDIKQRHHIHKSLFKHGKNHAKLQEVHNTTGQLTDWKLEVLEICSVKQFKRTETRYIQQYFQDPWCLNVMPDARAGKRGTTTKTQSRHKIAMSLLGKNTDDQHIHRPANLVFISPTGKRYENIISVKRFAQEHDLLQSSMNGLANGTYDAVLGWTIEGGPLPTIGMVYDMWPVKRLREHYPEYTVIDLDGNKYKTFYLPKFEEMHKVRVAKNCNEFGVKASNKALDKFGRGWRLDTCPTFTIVWEGKTYTNIISPMKFCQTFKIRKDRFINYLTQPSKYKRNYHIEMDAP